MKQERKTLEDVLPKKFSIDLDKEKAWALNIVLNLLKDNVPFDRFEDAMKESKEQLGLDLSANFREIVVQLSDGMHDRDWCVSDDCKRKKTHDTKG